MNGIFVPIEYVCKTKKFQLVRFRRSSGNSWSLYLCLEDEGNVHICWEACGHLNLLLVLAPQCLPHGCQQLRVRHVVTTLTHSVHKGKACSPSGTKSGDIGIRAGLVVLAPREHHHVRLGGPCLRSYFLSVAFIAKR